MGFLCSWFSNPIRPKSYIFNCQFKSDYQIIHIKKR